MTEQAREGGRSDLLDIYDQLTRTFVHGWRRTLEARVVFKCTQALSIGLHTRFLKLDDVPPKFAQFIELNRFEYREFDSYSYIAEATHLVYATALLDTFMTETTLFLFLARPRALAEKGQQVPLADVLKESSQAQLINKLAQDRVRRLGQESFTKRLDILEKKFELNIEVSPPVRERLKHFKSVRNLVVHDQGVYRLFLDASGAMDAEKKTCPVHPTRVTSKDVNEAMCTYAEAATALYAAVTRDVLGSGDHPRVRKNIAAFRAMNEKLAQSPPVNETPKQGVSA